MKGMEWGKEIYKPVFAFNYMSQIFQNVLLLLQLKINLMF